MSAAPKVTVLAWERAAPSDESFCKFARFLGLEVECVLLGGDGASMPESLAQAAPGGRIVSLRQGTLGRIHQHEWFSTFLEGCQFAFVHDLGPECSDTAGLHWLTSGAVRSISSLTGHAQRRVAIEAGVMYGDFPVTGRSYSLTSGDVPVFSGVEAGGATETYISVDGRPYFLSVRRGRTLAFMLAGEGLVDIDTPLSRDDSVRPWYAPLIAMSIALRAAGGPHCWNSPVTAANFIVDDLYLQRRYGFVRYQRLVEELEETQGALTAAFIPYNYRRSDPKVVGLLRRNACRFSIAVHGCDHTDAEYAGDDEEWLTGLTHCARERMEEHSRSTDMPFDNVMVFPKGDFSTQGLRAVGACGFDAVVNTTPWPVDARHDSLSIRDLIEVAVTRFDGTPIFGRRYPDDTFDFAFDAFFQRPLIAVSHHDYFREGYHQFSGFIRDLSAMKKGAVWMPLGRAVESSCLMKQTGDGHYRVRHLAWSLRVGNPTPGDWHLTLEKPLAQDSIKAVLVDEQEVPFNVSSGSLRYEMRLRPGETGQVRIVRLLGPRAKWEPSIGYRVRAALRRVLSDIRDNHLSRNKSALSLASGVKGRLIKARFPKKKGIKP